MKLEIGQKIKAIDTCVMFGSNNEALKVGKEYEIKAISKSSITIQSEEAVNHTFYIDELNKYFEIKSRSFNELKALVISWASQKGILKYGTALAQLSKTEEEVAELRESLEADAKGLEYYTNSKGEIVNTKEQIKDDLGDILTTIIIQSEMQGLDILECLESAYNVISKRKGQMINGTFKKDE